MTRSSPGESRAATAVDRWRRLAIRLSWVLGIVIVVVTPLAVRVAFEGRAELREADDAQQRGNLDREIEHLGRAARWRLPIAGHDEDALRRLLEIGAAKRAEGEVGIQPALSAYREARRAILATRAWTVPHRAMFDDANHAIAALMAEQERMLGTDLSGNDDPEGYHLALLQDIPGPDPVRANLAALAFLAWLVTTVGFVLRALDAHGKLRPRPALRWGGASIVMLIAWMVLLRHAG